MSTFQWLFNPAKKNRMYFSFAVLLRSFICVFRNKRNVRLHMVRAIACLSVSVKMISTFHAGSKCLLFTLFCSVPFFDTRKIKANKTVSFSFIFLLYRWIIAVISTEKLKNSLRKRKWCAARECAWVWIGYFVQRNCWSLRAAKDVFLYRKHCSLRTDGNERNLFEYPVFLLLCTNVLYTCSHNDFDGCYCCMYIHFSNKLHGLVQWCGCVCVCEHSKRNEVQSRQNPLKIRCVQIAHSFVNWPQ